MAGLLSISHCEQRMIATVASAFYMPNMSNRKTADFCFVFIIFLIYFISSLNYRIVIDLTTYAARSFPEKRKKQNVEYCWRTQNSATNWNDWMCVGYEKRTKHKLLLGLLFRLLHRLRCQNMLLYFWCKDNWLQR